jgi:putative spermidine/putrescine transport system permease protein
VVDARRSWWAYAVLLVAGVFFLAPLFAMARFAFQNVLVIDLGWGNLFDNWSFDKATAAFGATYFKSALWYSIRLAVMTSVVSVLIVVPTSVLVHLRFKRLRSIIEFLTLLPYVIPAIGLVAGIVVLKPYIRDFIASEYSLVPFYAVLSLPFTYRAIDNALMSIDLRTLVDASRSLGASWVQTVTRVVLPNIKTAVISGIFLTIAVVLGEYTIADVLLKRTLPSFMVEFRGTDPRGGYALAVLTLALTTLIFVLLGLATRTKHDKERIS